MRSLGCLGLFPLVFALGCSVAPGGGGAGAVREPTSGASAAPPLTEAEKKSASTRPGGGTESAAGDAEGGGGEAFGSGGLGLQGAGEGGGGSDKGLGLATAGAAARGSSGGPPAGGGGGDGKSRVRAATAETSGDGLDPEVVARVVRGGLGRMNACYEKAIAKDSTLAGKVAVKFTITAQGAVSQASASDTNIADADMVSCVVGAVRAMTFPALEHGGIMLVTYPFHFAPAGD